MLHTPVKPEFFLNNRARLAKKLPTGHLAVIQANDLLTTNVDSTVTYVPNTDLYYLTGVAQEETILVLFPDATSEKEREILYVREPTKHVLTWEGRKHSKEEASALSGIKEVRWAQQFEADFLKLSKQASGFALTFNEHLRAGDNTDTRNRRFVNYCKDRFPLHAYFRLSPLLAEMRMFKQQPEIDMILKALDNTDKGLRRVLKTLKPGVGEWVLEAEMAHEAKINKSQRLAYEPIIASGINACALHYVSNSKVCEDGELVLMDVGAEYGYWNADITRTFPVNGRFTHRQRAVYEAVRRVLDYAFSILRPGILPTEYEKKIIAKTEEQLIGLGLIDADEAAKQDEAKPLVRQYLMHGTSHHLGLDVHDVCLPNATIAPGMVLTIEPGIYLPDEGFGVRLEENIFIGELENTNLSANIPIDPDEIEYLMGRSDSNGKAPMNARELILAGSLS